MTALAVLALLAAGALYVAAGWCTPWPLRRTGCWLAGLAAAAVGVVLSTAHGEPARAHGRAPAARHGSAAAAGLAAPVTLALRALPVAAARRLARLLRAPPLRWAADPLVAVPVDAAGLWLLSGTGLHAAVAHRPALGALVALPVLTSGYLATAAVLAVDPAPHRRGVGVRAGALAAGAAAHDVLATWLSAAPHPGWRTARRARGSCGTAAASSPW